MELDVKAKFWRDHIVACATSGLTQDKYCVQHGINIKTFWCWKTKLIKLGEITRAREYRQSSSMDQLIPVAIAEQADVTVPFLEASGATRTDSGLVLRVGDRYSIQLGVQFDAAALHRLLACLGHG